MELPEESVGGTGSSETDNQDHQKDSTGSDKGNKQHLVAELEQQVQDKTAKIQTLEAELKQKVEEIKQCNERLKEVHERVEGMAGL